MRNKDKVRLPSKYPEKPGRATLAHFRIRWSGGSTFNAGAVDVRRRLTKGLQFDTFSKGMTSIFNSLRAPLTKGLSPQNITHALKMNWIYELPFGHGKPILANAHGAPERIVGGWALDGTGRVQSGSAFSRATCVWWG